MIHVVCKRRRHFPAEVVRAFTDRDDAERYARGVEHGLQGEFADHDDEVVIRSCPLQEHEA